MKTRTLVVIAVFTALIVGGLWYWRQSAPSTLTKMAEEAPKPAAPPAPAPKPAAQPQIEAPKAAPAPALHPVAKTLPPGVDPQLELNTAFDEIGSLMQSGDFATLREKYTPPETLKKYTPEENAQRILDIQQKMSNPLGAVIIQALSRMVLALKDEEPVMNAAGDEATYQAALPLDFLPPGLRPPTLPMTFVKIDGKWYIKNDDTVNGF